MSNWPSAQAALTSRSSRQSPARKRAPRKHRLAEAFGIVTCCRTDALRSYTLRQLPRDATTRRSIRTWNTARAAPCDNANMPGRPWPHPRSMTCMPDRSTALACRYCTAAAAAAAIRKVALFLEWQGQQTYRGPPRTPTT